MRIVHLSDFHLADNFYSFRSMNTKRYNDVRKQKIIKMLEQNKKTGISVDIKKIMSDIN